MLVVILINRPNYVKIAYDFRLKAWLVEAIDIIFFIKFASFPSQSDE